MSNLTGLGLTSDSYCSLALLISYCNDPKFLDRQVCANSTDPDQTAQFLHCLLFNLHHLEILHNGRTSY